jgi:hypothetical protein
MKITTFYQLSFTATYLTSLVRKVPLRQKRDLLYQKRHPAFPQNAFLLFRSLVLCLPAITFYPNLNTGYPIMKITAFYQLSFIAVYLTSLVRKVPLRQKRDLLYQKSILLFHRMPFSFSVLLFFAFQL